MSLHYYLAMKQGNGLRKIDIFDLGGLIDLLLEDDLYIIYLVLDIWLIS